MGGGSGPTGNGAEGPDGKEHNPREEEYTKMHSKRFHTLARSELPFYQPVTISEMEIGSFRRFTVLVRLKQTNWTRDTHMPWTRTSSCGYLVRCQLLWADILASGYKRYIPLTRVCGTTLKLTWVKAVLQTHAPHGHIPNMKNTQTIQIRPASMHWAILPGP